MCVKHMRWGIIARVTRSHRRMHGAFNGRLGQRLLRRGRWWQLRRGRRAAARGHTRIVGEISGRDLRVAPPRSGPRVAHFRKCWPFQGPRYPISFEFQCLGCATRTGRRTRYAHWPDADPCTGSRGVVAMLVGPGACAATGADAAVDVYVAPAASIAVQPQPGD